MDKISTQEQQEEQVNLNFMFKFTNTVGHGQMKYMLGVPEFVKRVNRYAKYHVHIDEKLLVRILQSILDDRVSGKLSKEEASISTSTVLNMINRLNRKIKEKEESSKVTE